MSYNDFTHLDAQGFPQMVDISPKANTDRVAVANSTVVLSEHAFGLLQDRAIPKGEVFTTAKIAGVQAAKQTPNLIPFCHHLILTHVDINFSLQEKEHSVLIESVVKTNASTGVEMEALVASQIAALTIYDMCKAVGKDIRIRESRLVFKSGGKSGIYSSD